MSGVEYPSQHHDVICVVVPSYNEGKHIRGVVEELRKEAYVDYIIVVDDCSQDDTVNIVEELARGDARVKCLALEKNGGVGHATRHGYELALSLGATIVAKVDGDGQMDIRRLPNLLGPLVRREADMTKGNRFHDFRALRSMPLMRRFGNMVLSFLTKVASGYWSKFDPTNGYFAIRTETLSSVNLDGLDPSYFFEISQLCQLSRIRAVIQDVPMPAQYGDETSHLNILKVALDFPPKLIKLSIRRFLFQHFVLNLSLTGLYMFAGIPLLLGGSLIGGAAFVFYATQGIPAPTGTVVLPSLAIILGFQLLLAGIGLDVESEPRIPLCQRNTLDEASYLDSSLQKSA